MFQITSDPTNGHRNHDDRNHFVYENRMPRFVGDRFPHPYPSPIAAGNIADGEMVEFHCGSPPLRPPPSYPLRQTVDVIAASRREYDQRVTAVDALMG